MTGNLSHEDASWPRGCAPANSMHSQPRTGGSRSLWRMSLLLAAGAFLPQPFCQAGEGPFFITYTHQMEEPGNLEFGTKNVTGRPSGGDRFMGTTEEFEYGVTAGWHASCAPDGSPLVGAGRRRPGKNLRAALSAIIPKRPGAWPIQFYDGCSMLARFPQRGRASSRLPGLARADLPFLAVHSRLPGR